MSCSEGYTFLGSCLVILLSIKPLPFVILAITRPDWEEHNHISYLRPLTFQLSCKNIAKYSCLFACCVLFTQDISLLLFCSLENRDIFFTITAMLNLNFHVEKLFFNLKWDLWSACKKVTICNMYSWGNNINLIHCGTNITNSWLVWQYEEFSFSPGHKKLN